ncbi:MAG: AraC family transcriptional regulator ligand-binding domain-containing protein [Halioglobus sp.]
MPSAYRVPGLFVPHLEAFVSRKGGDVDGFYTAAQLNQQTFLAHEETLSEDQFYALVEYARAVCSSPAFGLEIGQQFNLGSFGLLSRALMSCASLREFAKMLERYSVLVLPMVQFSTHETAEHFIVEERAFSRYPELNQLIFEATISFASKVTHLLLGRNVVVDKVMCQFEAPENESLLRNSINAKVSFGADQNRIYIQRAFVDLPLVTANPTDARVTKEECEKALIRSQQTQTLVASVLGHLRYYLDASPSSADVATKLNMTDRTFRRKLSQEGSSYRELLQSVRKEMAVYYLEHTQLQIAQIAQKLGYAETSNFRAAFKQWTGDSPRQWRQLRQISRTAPRSQ